MTLSCYTSCGNSVVATATHASSSCAADINVYVAYGSNQSAGYGLTIVTPTTTTLQSGYPVDSSPYAGAYESEYEWNLTDSCGNSDAGLDQNEEFGTWTNDYAGTDWFHPNPQGAYDSTSILVDYIGASGNSAPPAEAPQSPLTTVKVFHNTPWLLSVGTQTSGSGVQVHSDLQQWYQDHGRHQ